MYRGVFIKDFVELGMKLIEFPTSTEAEIENPLFTPYMQRSQIENIRKKFLCRDSLNMWLSNYSADIAERELSVAIVMAGNIPLVGFHDLLSVLACGYVALVKPSSKDSVLIHSIIDILFSINPYWRKRIKFFKKTPENADFIIVTGSSQTADHFKRVCAGVKCIIRGGRVSIGVISGKEEGSQIEALSDDIFLYFGMGCRNISTIFVPKWYDLQNIITGAQKYSSLLNLPNFINNYIYNRALFEMKRVTYTDGGFFLMREAELSTELLNAPPLSVVNIVRYSDTHTIRKFAEESRNSLQVIVGSDLSFCNVLPGETQSPSLIDFADGINILDELIDYLYLRTGKKS